MALGDLACFFPVEYCTEASLSAPLPLGPPPQVNLASRLEGLGKLYGVWVLISGRMYEQVASPPAASAPPAASSRLAPAYRQPAPLAQGSEEKALHSRSRPRTARRGATRQRLTLIASSAPSRPYPLSPAKA